MITLKGLKGVLRRSANRSSLYMNMCLPLGLRAAVWMLSE